MSRQAVIVNTVRTLRQARAGMTQEQLAQAIGVSRQTINAIEQGHYCPSLESALRLARVFDVKVEDLFQLDPG